MSKKLKSYKNKVYKTRFGIELEAEFPEKVDIMVLRQRYRKLLKSWTVTTDTSLNNGLEFKPKDINKLKFTKETLDEISEILHIIRKRKGTCSSAQCGLHIHIDMTSYTSEEILKIIKEMIARQNYIVENFNVSEDRLAMYCQLIKKSDLRKLKAETLESFRAGDYIPNIKYLDSKYYVLNVKSLQEFNTIEFRLFNGTKYIRDIKKILTFIYEFLINALEREWI